MKKNKAIIILISIIIISIIVIVILLNIAKAPTEEDIFTPQIKTEFADNEVEYVNIKDEDAIQMYLADYYNDTIFNIRQSYDKLDSEYKSIKFSTFESYSDYINSKSSISYFKAKEYIKKAGNNYTQYICINALKEVVVIKEYGPMDYKIAFDGFIGTEKIANKTGYSGAARLDVIRKDIYYSHVDYTLKIQNTSNEDIHINTANIGLDIEMDEKRIMLEPIDNIMKAQNITIKPNQTIEVLCGFNKNSENPRKIVQLNLEKINDDNSGFITVGLE